MERKTKVHAEPGKHDVVITREFDLPLGLLFKAYEDPEIIEQWMGSKALKLENKKYGGFQLEKRDKNGNVLFSADGVIHDFVRNQKIVRTFEMGNSPFGVQLEFLEFEKLTDDSSKLTMQVVYRSVELRDNNLKLPFSQGVNMAHDLLQKVLSKLK
jgi:uncharacterized protein YndB with AHSA1/START domain